MRKDDTCYELRNLNKSESPITCLPIKMNKIDALEVSSDEKWIATGTKVNKKERIYQWILWNIQSKDSIQLGRRSNLQFIRDSKLVGWDDGQDDRVVSIWQLDERFSNSPIGLAGHQGAVKYVKWTRDGNTLITASDDATIRIWDLNGLNLESIVLRGHTGPITALEITQDDQRILSGSSDGTVRLWRLWSQSASKAHRLDHLIEFAYHVVGRPLSTEERKQYLSSESR